MEDEGHGSSFFYSGESHFKCALGSSCCSRCLSLVFCSSPSSRQKALALEKSCQPGHLCSQFHQHEYPGLPPTSYRHWTGPCARPGYALSVSGLPQKVKHSKYSVIH